MILNVFPIGISAVFLMLFVLFTFSFIFTIKLFYFGTKSEQQFYEISIASTRFVSEEFYRLEFYKQKTVVCIQWYKKFFFSLNPNDSEKEFKNIKTKIPNISSCKYTISDVKNKKL